MPLKIEGSSIYHLNVNCPKLVRAGKKPYRLDDPQGLTLCSWCKSDHKNQLPDTVKATLRQLARYKYGTVSYVRDGFRIAVEGQPTLVVGRNGSMHFMPES